MFRSLRAALMAIAVPGVAAAILITAMSWMSYAALDETARKTFVAKDVVADILPPPMYLIEMRLVLSQGIEQTIPAAEAHKQFDRLVKEYDARVAYWTQNPPYGLEAKLLGAQHQAALKFIALARTEIIDRLAAGDLAGARKAMPAVQATYHDHRVGVDETVASGNQFADSQAALFDRTGERGRWAIVGVAVLMFALMTVTSVLALASIVRQLKRGVAMAQGTAAGRLTNKPEPTADDEFGQLQTAMLRMQDVLRRLIDAQTDLAREHTDAGRLGARIEVAGFEGSYRTMAEGVNAMVASQVALTDHIVDMVGQYGEGNFAPTMEDLPGEKARVTAAMRSVQDSLKAGAARAATNLRIRRALDAVDTNVMLSDAQDQVLYVNDSLARMFEEVEADLRQDLPGFSASEVIGSSASALIASAEHPSTLLAALQSTRRTVLKRGTRTFDLILTPILDADGERTGSALEWKDVTAQLAAREAEQRAIADDLRTAAENLRIKNALDVAEANVMLTDAHDQVLYLNESLLQMLARNEAALRRVLPDFDAHRLAGTALSPLLRSLGLEGVSIDHLNAPRHDELRVAGLTFGLILAPVLSDAGERVGTVLEWADRSAEVAVEQELSQIVDAAAAGDFAQRFGLEGKAPFFQQIGLGINRLLDTTASGLGDVVRVLGALAQGNLTQRIDANYSGTFGIMKNDANVTVEQLARIIGDIREASATIHSGAIEIASGNLNLSQRTEEQASSLQQTAATIEQLTTTVKQNADSARQANELATTASAVAVKGGNVVNQVVQTMNSITDSSKKIVDIISVIDGIAFQTNILALNAAVEAARAGEQGRGFAVVAGEVRSLAQRSASAAKEIKTLIGDSVDKVDAGSRLVDAAGQTMQDIVSSVKRVTDIMGEISSASLQQSSGIEQVNQAIALMDQATQQNAALVEQAAASAESMREQAGNLATSVGIFTMD